MLQWIDPDAEFHPGELADLEGAYDGGRAGVLEMVEDARLLLIRRGPAAAVALMGRELDQDCDGDRDFLSVMLGFALVELARREAG
jgi:hypothetical protein